MARKRRVPPPKPRGPLDRSALPLIALVSAVACGPTGLYKPILEAVTGAHPIGAANAQPSAPPNHPPPNRTDDRASRSKRPSPKPPPGAKAGKGVPLGPPLTDDCVGRWCGVQIGHAAIIVDAGRRAGLPERAWVIAVATAMQESALFNQATDVYPVTRKFPHDRVGEDHDSVGLFQQRPSSGWGTPQELMDPRTAAERFYASLKRVIKKRRNWQNERLTVIAQAVQRSAYPNAYQKHEANAKKIVDLVLRYPYTGKKGTDRRNGFVMFQCKNPRHSACQLMRWKYTRPVTHNREAFKKLFPHAAYKGDLGDKRHMDATPPQDHTPGAKNNRPGWIYAQDFGGGKGFDIPDFFVWLAKQLMAGKYKEVKYIICTHPRLKHYEGGKYYGTLSRSNNWRATSNDGHDEHVHISYRAGYEQAHSTIIADYYKYKNGA